MASNIQQDAGQKTGAVLVIGGGIGGIQAALDLAESGYKEEQDMKQNRKKHNYIIVHHCHESLLS